MVDFKDKKILITGSGFLATELVKQLLEKGAKPRVFARNEGGLLKLKNKYPETEIFIGDIADPVSVQQGCKNIDAIASTSATKVVGLSETFTRETVRTNVLGSLNILEQSLQQPFEFVLGVSTDKACAPNGIYACSKYLMEGLFQQFERINPNCRYLVPRYGNVLNSTNSVVPLWKSQIEAGEDVYLNSPTATRFWWPVKEAAEFVFKCIDEAPDSKPYIPQMKGMSVAKLLEAVILKYGQGKKVNVIQGNLLSADNLHEKMEKDGLDSSQVPQFTIEEILPLI